MSGAPVTVLSEADVRAKLADLEASVPGLREAYESDENHGDSCWESLVDWNPLASSYAAYRWLLDGGAA